MNMYEAAEALQAEPLNKCFDCGSDGVEQDESIWCNECGVEIRIERKGQLATSLEHKRVWQDIRRKSYPITPDPSIEAAIQRVREMYALKKGKCNTEILEEIGKAHRLCHLVGENSVNAYAELAQYALHAIIVHTTHHPIRNAKGTGNAGSQDT